MGTVKGCMSGQRFSIIWLGTAALVASALLLAQTGSAPEAHRARELIRHLGGAELEKERVRIKSVSSGIGGDAIVEAQLLIAFRFKRDKDEWRVAEVRLGDRQWEDLGLITEAVRREKIRRTVALIEQLARSLETFRREHGRYVESEEIADLLDHLSPRYTGLPQRFDLWGTPLTYRGTPSEYRLLSAGPDRKWQTSDDLVLENGQWRQLPN